MRTVILFGLAAGMMVSAAAAEPLKLDDSQMESTTAGVLSLPDIKLDLDVTNQTNVGAITSIAEAINVLSAGSAEAGIAGILTQINAHGGVVPSGD